MLKGLTETINLTYRVDFEFSLLIVIYRQNSDKKSRVQSLE